MNLSLGLLTILITLTKHVEVVHTNIDELEPAELNSDSQSEGSYDEPQLSMIIVARWADRIAGELLNFNEYITQKEEVHNSFKELIVTEKDGKTLVDHVAADMRTLLTNRMNAALRIAKRAEDVAAADRDVRVSTHYQYYGSAQTEPQPNNDSEGEKNVQKRAAPIQLNKSPDTQNNVAKYPNTLQKQLARNESDYADFETLDYYFKDIPKGEEPETEEKMPCLPPDSEPYQQCHLAPLAAALTQSRRFKDRVNMSLSSVQVPGDSYDWNNETIKAIRWSEKLDSVFRKNFAEDPLMLLQYFGSSHGFLRHYPASHWKPGGPGVDSITLDIYDARFRSWYLEAAATPRDVLILLDSSGSMNGSRRKIGHKLLEQLLKTLGDDDFFNVYRFTKTLIPFVPCFNNTFVQATYGNKHEVLSVINQPRDRVYKSELFADYGIVLPLAFEQFRHANSNPEGGYCNKAMVIITDEIPSHFEDIFRYYNNNKTIRMFTFIIGIEVTNTRPAQWIACAHRGHYAQLITDYDVRERALDHVNVLARPLVLQQVDHPLSWTGIYAHAQEPMVAEFLWREKENMEQVERYMALRKGKEHFLSSDERQIRFLNKKKLTTSGGYNEDRAPYMMLTTVSTPAYDKQKYVNITYEDEQGREGMDVTKTFRVARLLGVAGVDVLLEDLYHITRPHMLGVGGYAFLINNNGHVLLHPDLRPYFRGILKPNYRNVDLIELELFDDDRAPRDFNPVLIDFRRDVLKIESGDQYMNVKYHTNNMRTVSRIRQQYFWSAVRGTPFVVGIVLPEAYGLTRASHPSAAIPPTPARAAQISEMLLNDDNWTIHPDWLYCRHVTEAFNSSRYELLHMLALGRSGDWHWPKRPSTLPKHFWKPRSGNSSEAYLRSSYYCDGDLMSLLLHDIRVTSWFSVRVEKDADNEKGKELLRRFGPSTVFLATHSGLTRWRNVFPTTSKHNESIITPFGEVYSRATDEAWYRRAVEQHKALPYSLSYTVEDDGEWLLAAQWVFVENQTVQSSGAGGKPRSSSGTAVKGSGNSKKEKGEAVKKSPASTVRNASVAVLGFRFRRVHLQTLLEEVTSKCGIGITDCSPKVATCGVSEHATWRCLLLENGGRVVAGEGYGRALADTRPRLMRSLVAAGVYNEIVLPDYQGVCFRDANEGSPATRLVQPVTVLMSTVRWLGEQLIRLAVWYYALALDAYTLAQAEKLPTTPATPYHRKNKKNVVTPLYDKLVKVNRTTAQACDRTARAWQLNYTATFRTPPVACVQPFTAHPLHNNSLLLLVYDTRCPEDDPLPITDERPEFVYNSSLPCARRATKLFRKRPYYCHSTAAEENESTMMCSTANNIPRATWLLTTTTILSQVWFD